MANLALAFRQEIIRYARREARQEVASLRNTVTKLRGESVAAKQRIAALEQEVKVLRKTSAARVSPPSAVVSALVPGKFSPAGFAKLRKHLGLTQNDMAMLFAVSSQTIYNWERVGGKHTHPSEDQLKKLAYLRTLKKADIQGIVANLKAAGR